MSWKASGIVPPHIARAFLPVWGVTGELAQGYREWPSSSSPALPQSPGKAWLPGSVSPLLTTSPQGTARQPFQESEPERAKCGRHAGRGAAEVGVLCF